MTQKEFNQLRFPFFRNVALRNIPEERRHQLRHGESLKSRKADSRYVPLFRTYFFSKNIEGQVGCIPATYSDCPASKLQPQQQPS
jgi:hypothetical protein